jgi:hypothetical protein
MKRAASLALLLATLATLAGCQEVLMGGAEIFSSLLRPPMAFFSAPSRKAQAEADNRPRPFSGVVVDDHGQELAGARLHLNYARTIYSASGNDIEYLQDVRPLAPRFEELIPRQINGMTVSHEDFYPRRYYVDKDFATLSSEAGHEAPSRDRQPLTDARILLRRHGPFTRLERRLETLWVDPAGAGMIVSPALPYADFRSATWSADVEHAPDGFLDLTTARADGAIPSLTLTAHRGRDQFYQSMPAEIRVGLRGRGNGVQLFTPARDGDEWFEMRRAPDDGYQNEITLDRDALQRCVDARPLWFFFKVNGRYGRGWLDDFDTSQHRDGGFLRYGMRVVLEMQPDGSTNLEEDFLPADTGNE